MQAVNAVAEKEEQQEEALEDAVERAQGKEVEAASSEDKNDKDLEAKSASGGAAAAKRDFDKEANYEEAAAEDAEDAVEAVVVVGEPWETWEEPDRKKLRTVPLLQERPLPKQAPPTTKHKTTNQHIKIQKRQCKIIKTKNRLRGQCRPPVGTRCRRRSPEVGVVVVPRGRFRGRQRFRLRGRLRGRCRSRLLIRLRLETVAMVTSGTESLSHVSRAFATIGTGSLCCVHLVAHIKGLL